jgi:hypothetical protein
MIGISHFVVSATSQIPGQCVVQSTPVSFQIPSRHFTAGLSFNETNTRQQNVSFSSSLVIKLKLTSWHESASELYRPSDRRLPETLVTTFAVRRCRVVIVTDLYGRILRFLDFFFQAALQFYSRGWVDPVPDPLLLRKSGSAENRTQTSGSVARNSDHA